VVPMDKLTHRELMCVYFGFVTANNAQTEQQKSESLQLTAQILGMTKDEYNDISSKALDGLRQVNEVLENMLKLAKEGKNPFKKQGGGNEWR